jgi:hypothetical protein
MHLTARSKRYAKHEAQRPCSSPKGARRFNDQEAWTTKIVSLSAYDRISGIGHGAVKSLQEYRNGAVLASLVAWSPALRLGHAECHCDIMRNIGSPRVATTGCN